MLARGGILKGFKSDVEAGLAPFGGLRGLWLRSPPAIAQTAFKIAVARLKIFGRGEIAVAGLRAGTASHAAGRSKTADFGAEMSP